MAGLLAGWKDLIFRKLSEPAESGKTVFPEIRTYSPGSLSGAECDIHFPQNNHHHTAPRSIVILRHTLSFSHFYFWRSFLRRTTNDFSSTNIRTPLFSYFAKGVDDSGFFLQLQPRTASPPHGAVSGTKLLLKRYLPTLLGRAAHDRNCTPCPEGAEFSGLFRFVDTDTDTHTGSFAFERKCDGMRYRHLFLEGRAFNYVAVFFFLSG